MFLEHKLSRYISHSGSLFVKSSESIVAGSRPFFKLAVDGRGFLLIVCDVILRVGVYC